MGTFKEYITESIDIKAAQKWANDNIASYVDKIVVSKKEFVIFVNKQKYKKDSGFLNDAIVYYSHQFKERFGINLKYNKYDYDEVSYTGYIK